METHTRAWLSDVLIGGLVGTVFGAIAAVNVIIYAGIDRGYEASIRQVFRQSTIVGVVTVLVFAAGPVAGILVARRLRRKRSASAG